MQEKSKPQRINIVLLERANAVAIEATAKRNKLQSVHEIIQEAMDRGLKEIERELGIP